MAHKGELPQYQRLITAHNEDGKAVFAKIDETGPWDGSINGGTVGFSLGYTTSTTPVDMNDDKDMAQYKEYLVSPPGLVNKSGSVLRFVVSVSNSNAILRNADQLRIVPLVLHRLCTAPSRSITVSYLSEKWNWFLIVVRPEL
jgi:hypothetical protein